MRASLELIGDAACAQSLAAPAFLDARMAERARLCAELRDRLCADIGERTRACKLARERSSKLSPEACAEMRANYAAVRDQLAGQPDELRLPPEAAARLLAGDPPARGPRGAKLQLVEFVDFESLYCAQAAPIVRALLAKHGAQLRVTLRMRPLEENAHARLAAEAALAAHAQGKFWEMHDLLLSHQHELERPALERYAAELQLDLPAFRAALDKHSFAPAIDADLALVEALKISAMPAMYLNGERILNTVDQELLQDAAEEYLARP